MLLVLGAFTGYGSHLHLMMLPSVCGLNSVRQRYNGKTGHATWLQQAPHAVILEVAYEEKHRLHAAV